MNHALSSIDLLLSRWGRWSIKNISGGLGYAKMSLIMGAHEGDGRHDPAPPPDVSNEDFNQISKAIQLLPVDLVMVVVQFYVKGAEKSDSFNARTLNMSRDTMQRRIQEAQRRIAAYLDDLETGRTMEPVLKRY